MSVWRAERACELSLSSLDLGPPEKIGVIFSEELRQCAAFEDLHDGSLFLFAYADIFWKRELPKRRSAEEG